MSLFKRISATITTRVDQMVARIENHDAIVEVALADTRQTLAQAKVRLSRVRRDGERLEARLEDARRAEQSWSDRARTSAHQEETALECLRRRNAAHRDAEETATALRRHREMEQRLKTDVCGAEARVIQLSQQRNLMRTRQSAAEALSALTTIDAGDGRDLDAAFERWEEQIIATELSVGANPDHDALERGFIDSEERTELRRQLDELMQEEGRHEH